MRLCGGFHTDGEPRFFKATLDSPDPAIQRYWFQGPLNNITPTSQRLHTTWDNVEAVPTRWLYRVHLASVPLGVDRVSTEEAFERYWQNSKGWIRAGVWIEFTPDPDAANCTLHLHDDGNTSICRLGVSCARRYGGHDTIMVRRSHLAAGPYVPNHEINHGVTVACDMYHDPSRVVVPGSYWGIMDNGVEQSSWPRDRDIRFTSAWLRGEAQYTSC